jgi:hypothetical protein
VREPKSAENVQVRGTLRPKQVTGNKPVVDEYGRHVIPFPTMVVIFPLRSVSSCKVDGGKGIHDGKGISMYRIIIVET